MAGLGLGPQAIASGSIIAVPPDHALTLEAARRLANAAALTQGQNQAGSVLHPVAQLVPTHALHLCVVGRVHCQWSI